MEPSEKIVDLQRSVKEGISVEIDGVRVDVMTAAAILTVYEALPAKRRDKFARKNIPEMASEAWETLRDESRRRRNGTM